MDPDGSTPPANDQRRLYGDLAWMWPIVSPPDHYVQDSERYLELVRSHSKIDARTLLHLGCGGGHADLTLKRYLTVTGVDLSKVMLDEARGLNPEASYHLGDMRRVRLGESFDAVFALDSVNYLLTEDDLRMTFETAHVHLNPGGVFLTCVEETPDRFQQNKTFGYSNAAEGIDITFVENYHDPDPSDTTYEATFVYFIRRYGGLEIETDRHVCGLFPLDTWTRLLEERGFEVQSQDYREDDEGRGYNLLAALKPD